MPAICFVLVSISKVLNMSYLAFIVKQLRECKHGHTTDLRFYFAWSTWNLFDQEHERKLSSDDMVSQGFLHLYRMLLSHLFNNYKTAEQESEMCLDFVNHAPSSQSTFSYIPLFYGLSLLAWSRETGRGNRRVIEVTRKQIRQLERQAKQTPRACGGKLFLLRAELSRFLGEHDEVHFLCTCAIALSSSDAGILLDQALANERACRHVLERDKTVEASTYCQEAKSTYLKWGAFAKADLLTEEVSQVFGHEG